MRTRLFFAACLALVVSALPARAQTDPRPADDRLAEAEHKLSELVEATERAAERFNVATERVRAARVEQARSLGGVVRVDLEVARRRNQVAELAVSAYKRGPASALAVVDSADMEALTGRAAYLARVADKERAALEGLRGAQADAAVERRRLADVGDRAQAELARADTQRQAVEALLVDQEHLVAQYRDEAVILRSRRAAEESEARRKAEQAERERALQAATAEEQARRAAATVPEADQPPPPPPPALPAPAHAAPAPALPTSPGASTALEWAKAQLGKPYRYAGAGPDDFDCSGLTQYVWGKAGVDLPHAADLQYEALPHVPRSQLQPGDLVFFGSDLHHEGIYVGANTMIHAPQTGEVVSYQDIGRQDYFGAARP